jgi:cytoskeletal protein CcmA (bactofilin family)
MVSGSFTGDIDAERLEIVTTGQVNGTVVVGQLVIESGASFNGTSKIRGQEPPRQLRHDKGDEQPARKKGKEEEKVD